jgi:hypothetical protein
MLPQVIINHILEYDGRILYRKGEYVNRIPRTTIENLEKLVIEKCIFNKIQRIVSQPEKERYSISLNITNGKRYYIEYRKENTRGIYLHFIDVYLYLPDSVIFEYQYISGNP